MTPKSYDQIWREKHTQEMWTIPDHEVIALLTQLFPIEYSLSDW